MYKIIDIHTHTYPEKIAAKACDNLGKFYNFKVRCKGTYNDLEQQAKECNVRGFLLFSVATNPHQVEKLNNGIAELTQISRENGFETTGFAGMHQDFSDYRGEIDRCEKLGLRGIKIHPDIQLIDIDDPKMLRLYELIEGRMPLYLHMGDDRPEYRYSQPDKLARVLDIFPDLEVVAAHLGGYRSWEAAENYIFGRPNVWYDTSSALWAMTAEQAQRLIALCGYDRVMFGTDYPVCTLRHYIDLFLRLELTEKQREDIFYNNAKRFLRM